MWYGQTPGLVDIITLTGLMYLGITEPTVITQIWITTVQEETPTLTQGLVEPKHQITQLQFIAIAIILAHTAGSIITQTEAQTHGSAGIVSQMGLM